MKQFLIKTFALVIAISVPAVYSVKTDTYISAVGSENQTFFTSLPDFEYIIGQKDGRPVFVADGTEYKNTDTLSRSAVDFPAEFDMRQQGTISSVKDQGQHGTCWTHSSASSAESSIIGAIPSINLSELHTAFYSYYGDDQISISAENIEEHLDWGGSTGIVANLWSQWIGPVNEDRLPYENTAFLEDSENAGTLKYESDYHLENAYLFDFDSDRTNVSDINNLVKQFLYDGHAVDVSFYHEYGVSYNGNKFCVNSNFLPKNANHSVTIVGWDDNFSANNFIITPEHNGAWLVKNSWGYNAGDDGYIWISYDDKSLCQFAVYELADNDNYSVNYHYDTFVPSQLLSAHNDTEENNSSYMANIFTAESDMQIEAIATYFQNSGTEYNVTIYTGLTDESDPSSGTPSEVTSGYDTLTGYRTIKLSESVPVKSGEKFGVVVEMLCNDNPFVIPVESSLFVEDSKTGEITDINKYSSMEQIEKYTGENESFYSADGKNWSDIYSGKYTYSEERKNMILEMLKEEIYAGIPEEDEEAMEKADELYNSYEELFASGDLCETFGNISLKAFGSPSGTVKFSHIAGAVPENESVSLSADKDIFISVNGDKYIPYTEPIKITEETKISAYTDPLQITEKTYIPEKAVLNDLCYRAYDSGYRKAERISDNEYVINVSSYDYAIKLYPVTGAEVTMDGKKIPNAEYTDIITLMYGEQTVTFELEQENKLPNTVTVKIIKNPVSFSLENETILCNVGFRVTTEDGTTLKNGDSVSKYAGQEITAVNNSTSEKFTFKVPERAVLPELETDYYYEMLGFIPNDTAELLEYSVKENPTEDDYVSASDRLVDGTWINSGMVMNKAFKVIPNEKITFRISAGNGMFTSEPVTYEIPVAKSAPENIPEFTEKDGKFYLSGYDYEVAPIEDTDISELAEKWGYSGNEEYISAVGKRFGIADSEKVKSLTVAEWSTGYAMEKGQTVALRYSSTDSDFASECIIFTVGEPYTKKGDVDGNGMVNAVDATLVLVHYADLSTGGKGTIEPEKISVADYNGDGIVDAVDATRILIHYSKVSTHITNE